MFRYFLPMLTVGVVWWCMLFILIGFIAISPFLSTPGPIMFEMNIYGKIVQYASIIFSTCVALWWLQYWIGDAQYDVKTAIIFACYLIVIGVGLDALITVPFFIGDYWHFFTLPEQWIDYMLVVALCLLAAL